MRAFVLVVALWLGAWPAPTRALDVPGARLVVVEGDVDPALADTLGELLGRLGLTAVREPREGQVVARVRIASAGDGAEVFVEDALGRGISVRRRVRAEGSSALFRETVAHVVLGAVEPLAELPVETKSEALAQLDTPPHRAPEPPRTPLTVALSARGGPHWLEPGRAAVELGGGIALGIDTRWAPGVGLDVATTWPVTVARRGIEAELTLWALRLTPRLTLLRGQRAGLDLGLAGGVDLVSLVPQRTPLGTTSRGSSRRTQPVVGGFARVHVALVRRLALFVSVGADVDLAPRRWVIEREAEALTLGAVARVRPYALLGLAWMVPTSRDGEAAP